MYPKINFRESSSVYCPNCMKQLKQKRSLKRHMLLHCSQKKTDRLRMPIIAEHKPNPKIESKDVQTPFEDNLPLVITHSPKNNNDLALYAGQNVEEFCTDKNNVAVPVGMQLENKKQLIGKGHVFSSVENKTNDPVASSTKHNDDKDDSGFICATCSKVFQQKRTMMFHIRYECGKVIQCTSCNKVFMYKKDLIRHNKQGCMTIFECSICGDKFKQLAHLKAHEKYECGKILKCPACSKVFRRNTSLNYHLKQCNVASSASTSNKPIAHNDNNIDESGFRCSTCSKVFKHKHTLVSHIQEECKEVKQFQCTFCKKTFKHKRTLVFHIRNDCGKVIQCTSCKKVLMYKKDLRCHEKFGCVSVFECSTCGDKFKQISNLQKHRNKECGETLKCPSCSKVFMRKSSLSRHLLQCNSMKET